MLYKKIRVHLVYDANHYGLHKVRLVADVNLTDIQVESVYFGVISLCGIQILAFFAELNTIETWATDIGNAYLEANTFENVYIIEGNEFGDREGHIRIVAKALYYLLSSGLKWYERFADCLRDMGLFMCKLEPAIWIR